MLNKGLTIIAILATFLQAQPGTPFERGVNLSNWFQESSAQEIEFTKYTFEDFQDIQSLGVDVIRLPVNLHGMSSGSPDYTLDPLLLHFLDQVVDWSEVLGVHLIIDNHSFAPTGTTQPSVYSTLLAVWTQLAEHYLDRDLTLYYEILNEPVGIDDMVWNTIQQSVVNAIRTIDSDRTLIVGPASWNSYNSLDNMLVYTDPNLIYTYHFYDPFIFSHQGASWTDPSMVNLTGVPFPYDATRMPAVPSDLVGTWVQSNMVSYASSGTVEALYELMDIAIAFRDERQVPIYCGEFGVLMSNAPPADRVYWYEEIVTYLDSLDVGWTMWDYHGGFGLYEVGGYNLFDHDLNIPLLEAMGLNVPDQTPFSVLPDSGNIQIYGDYIGQYIQTDFHTGNHVSLYSGNDPRHGDFCINWEGGPQYDRLGFKFQFPRDLSYLHAQQYLLTLWIRPSGTPQDFHIRFIDTKTDVPEDHPWRMTQVINSGDLMWDGSWQYVQIPLTNMEETGSWDEGWFDPQGDFDWASIQYFELAAEPNSLEGSSFSFDDIRIVDAITAGTNQRIQPRQFSLSQNYPNPFNGATQIPLSLARTSPVKVSVYDLNGRLIQVLLDEALPAGENTLTWKGETASGQALASGIYLLQVKAGDLNQILKMSLLK